MRHIIALALAICGLAFLTACEHEHHQRDEGYRGGPGSYDYGHGGYYTPDGRWEQR